MRDDRERDALLNIHNRSAKRSMNSVTLDSSIPPKDAPKPTETNDIANSTQALGIHLNRCSGDGPHGSMHKNRVALAIKLPHQ